MLLATICLLPQAFFRWPVWPGHDLRASTIGCWVLLALIACYDFLTMRKIHLTTLGGGAAITVTSLVVAEKPTRRQHLYPCFALWFSLRVETADVRPPFVPSRRCFREFKEDAYQNVHCSHSLALSHGAAESQPAAPDLVLLSRKVFTSDAGHPYVQELAIREERITATGDSAAIRALVGPHTKRIDLRGRTVIPALSTSHTTTSASLPPQSH